MQWKECAMRAGSVQLSPRNTRYGACLVQRSRSGGSGGSCRVYVWSGGAEHGKPVQDGAMWILDLERLGWVRLDAPKVVDGAGRSGAVPPTRQGHSLVACGPVLYLFGGLDSEQRACSDLWQYHTESHQWTQLSSDAIAHNGPKARSAHAAVVVQDRWMLVHGGLALCADSKSAIVLDDLWAFDTYTHQWTQLECEPDLVRPEPRLDHALTTFRVHDATISEKLYPAADSSSSSTQKVEKLVLFGGMDLKSVMQDVWVVDPWVDALLKKAGNKVSSSSCSVAFEQKIVDEEQALSTEECKK